MDARRWLHVALAACLLLGGCGGEDADPSASGAASDGAATTPAVEPTRELLVQTLRDLLAAIETEDYDTAQTFLVPLPNMTPEDVPAVLRRMVETRDLTGPGIDLLADEGVFDEMDELFGERGWSWARRAGVDHNACWALTFDDAEVAAHWNGEAFRIIRLDDVGRMK